jgi:superfamily I DNA/RNA helicase
MLSAIISQSGLLAGIEREDEKAARDRKENLEQLVAAAAEYESTTEQASLGDFIDRVSLLGVGDGEAVASICCRSPRRGWRCASASPRRSTSSRRRWT